MEEAHSEAQAVQNKAIEAAFQVGRAMGENVQDHGPVGGELEASRSMKTGQKTRLLGSIKKAKTMWERWYEAIKEEEKLQSNKDITVRFIMMRHAPADLRGGTLLQHPRVLVATVAYQENPPLCLQILHAARFQVLRGVYILLRVLADTRSQEAQGLPEEIRRQSGVFVLSGPATVITNVATASVFLAKGWSIESVSRVVRTVRTRQDKHEKERAEHAYYKHIHDEMTVSDIFPATTQRLEEDEDLPEDTTAQDEQEGESEQSLSESLQISKVHENMGHPSSHTRWYECYVLVEPSTCVVLVRHRNVQSVQSRVFHPLLFYPTMFSDLTFSSKTYTENNGLRSHGKPRILVIDQQRNLCSGISAQSGKHWDETRSDTAGDTVEK